MTDPKMPEPAAWIVFSGWHPVAVHLSSAGASADRDRRQMSDDLSGNLAAHRVAPAIFLAAAQAYAEALSAARVAQERERTYTRAQLLSAIEAERHACSIAVWMTLQDALADDADDKGLDGWMREAEERIKTRIDATSHTQPPETGKEG